MNLLSRKTARRSAAILGALAGMLSLSITAGAQQGVDGLGAWRVEPYVGIWDQGDRGQTTLRRIGPLVGLRVSQQRGAVVRLIASAAYHRVNDAFELRVTSPTGESRTDVYDAEILSVTAGVAGDLWQSGAAAVSVGIELGAAWDHDRLDRSTGATTDPFIQRPYRDDWTPVFLVVPSLTVRRAVGPRLELTATARLLLGFGDFSPSTVPTVGAGMAFRL